LLALAVLVLYVGMSNNCEELGRQIKAAENEKNELLKQVATEEQKWAHARSYQQMERLMAQYGIEMDWPEEKDIIRLHVARDGAPVEYARVR